MNNVAKFPAIRGRQQKARDRNGVNTNDYIKNLVMKEL